MNKKPLSDGEMNLAELIWAKEPLPSGQLVALCAEHFHWKKSTTYTVLKHLCEYGYFSNQDTIVRSCISKEEYLGQESNRFVKEHFGGSLSRFLTAFAGGGKLSKKQVEEIQDMINRFGN